MRKGYIYEIKNISNNKIYIGQTTQKNPNSRWNKHKHQLKTNSHNNLHLQQSWNKYGEDNFKFNILYEYICDNKNQLIDILNNVEEQLILKNNSCNNKFGYNIRSGGNNSFHSNESKIKMSISRKGKQGTPHTLETKIKISNGNKGKKLSDEIKLKISNSEKGKIISEETRKNMSKAQTGKNNNFYGKKHTEETLIRIKESKQQNRISRYLNQKELIISIYNDFEKGLKYKEVIQKYGIKQWLAQDIKLKKGIFKNIIESGI